MKGWVRRFRGAIGLGLAWASGFFLVGVGVALVGWDFGVDAFGNGLLWVAYNSLVSAATGFISGATFSAFLSVVEGRRRFDEMTLPRFAMWGGIGGTLVAGVLSIVIGWGTPSMVANTAILGLLGAASAAGTLSLARSAEDRELLEGNDQIVQVGLTESEARELLSDA